MQGRQLRQTLLQSLTVSGITASNKTYDGSTNATLDASSVAYSGLVSGDTFNGTYTGAFSDKNVGTGKTVTITLHTVELM